VADTFWQKQTLLKPLYPDLLWSRPENKRQAGKLLIIGGSSHGFAAVGKAYAAATRAGIGTARVVLPDSTKKILGSSLEAGFAPSTPSGSFAQNALATSLEQAEWADAVLLAGDFGRNSETAILLEKFVEKYKGQLTLVGDGLDYFLDGGSAALARPKTLLVINLGQLQKLAAANRPNPAIKQSASLQSLVEILHGWTNENRQLNLLTQHAGQIVVARAGQVSTTPAAEPDWPAIAAYASVWWLQQTNKTFEAVTTAVFEYLKLASVAS